MIKEVETVSYSIEGIVADNASINTKMFKILNPGGNLSHVIPHLNSDERKFFVSFDSSDSVESSLTERRLLNKRGLLNERGVLNERGLLYEIGVLNERE